MTLDIRWIHFEKDTLGHNVKDDLIHILQTTVEFLEAENFRLKSVIEHLPGSIYWKDKEGVYLGRNTFSLEKMQSVELEHGSTVKDDVIGKTDYDLFPKEVADRYREHDLTVMRTQKEHVVEEATTLPSGRTIIQLSTKRPVYDQKGEVIGVVGNTVDITHLKEIEAELRREHARAEQANLIKTEFMRNMEHDIRTPFSGVLGMTRYLWETEENPTKKECLNDIVQCAQELLDYCNSILDFSKIESGMHFVAEKKFHLQEIVKSAVKMELPAAKLKQLQLEVDYDESIPVVLVGDPHRIHRILVNLLSNAIKFTQQGHVKLTVIRLSKDASSPLVRFMIEDTGVGIPEEKQDYVFEKFARLSLSNKGFHKGIGLGLRIVKQFMHEIEGEIDLISAVGQGTQFICTIPFRRPLTDDFVNITHKE